MDIKENFYTKLEQLREEILDEKAKWRKGKPVNPASLNNFNNALKPTPTKRGSTGTWAADGSKGQKVTIQKYRDEVPTSKHGPRRGAYLP